ncbi:2-C-methyl-D-erythritol 4-phosphate cytidylyltransferase [Simiduia agarivorans]|uniref:2-C-methyl-D-erythritol 4-phosphate cytidylyltransferase n=1 Tax=Simiduia agarivorans (strain DSM 21679 / JCM 13881 / BCRC 17597 / SA1) TaxID=1117647 RepID=K4KJL6_SIMAS|nr:2-C-methyl-D-erythritol 4-phosphate cytidylyltransferase [Simiduia agarivorans]AFU98193.1 2-C-methyl-D-erythritol 4-phosphate cytidylyltransferase [Simiduia agarivorans SA1 = DSM 21679]
MNTPKIWVLVPAAGTGSRMQSETPKQYLSLNGQPVLEHTLNVLLQTPQLAGVIVALGPEDERFGSLAVARDPRVQPIVGGRERADSVLAGLRYLAKRAASHDWVLVHDAARPCLTVSLLHSFCEKVASETEGGILAVPVADTLKWVEQSTIGRTVDRSHLWAAQTPQMFPLFTLTQALDAALTEGVPVTDEASAMEWAGHTVAVVPGAPGNIKITQPQDLALAALILRAQEES